MDTIWNCAFGLDINLQVDRNNEYLTKSEAVFKSTTETLFALVITCTYLRIDVNNISI